MGRITPNGFASVTIDEHGIAHISPHNAAADEYLMPAETLVDFCQHALLAVAAAQTPAGDEPLIFERTDRS